MLCNYKFWSNYASLRFCILGGGLPQKVWGVRLCSLSENAASCNTFARHNSEAPTFRPMMHGIMISA